MSNIIQESTTWYLDTEGVITPKPVWVKKVVFHGKSDEDGCLLTYFGNESPEPTVRSTMIAKSVAVSSTTTITSTGNFEATEALANDIIHIYTADEVLNEGFFQVGTRSNDNAVICDVGYKALTNDAAGTYSWRVWKPSTAIKMFLTQDDSFHEIDFGPTGHRFPNLALNSLTSNGTLYIYIR